MRANARLALALSLLFVGVGGATTVFLLGSHNRSADRAAVLTYESRVLAQVREMSVVAGSLGDVASAYAGGRLPQKAFRTTVTEYAGTLERVRMRIGIVPVPRPFGFDEQMFRPAAAAYARSGREYLAAAACPRLSCADGIKAKASWDEALALFRRAADLLASTRARLGLGPSPNFADPPR